MFRDVADRHWMPRRIDFGVPVPFITAQTLSAMAWWQPSHWSPPSPSVTWFSWASPVEHESSMHRVLFPVVFAPEHQRILWIHYSILYQIVLVRFNVSILKQVDVHEQKTWLWILKSQSTNQQIHILYNYIIYTATWYIIYLSNMHHSSSFYDNMDLLMDTCTAYVHDRHFDLWHSKGWPRPLSEGQLVGRTRPQSNSQLRQLENATGYEPVWLLAYRLLIGSLWLSSKGKLHLLRFLWISRHANYRIQPLSCCRPHCWTQSR